MIIAQAEPADLSAVLAMRYEASAWLADIGVDQWRRHWPTKDAMVERIGDNIQAGETWMVRDHQNHLAATVAPRYLRRPRVMDTRRDRAAGCGDDGDA